MAKSQKKGIVLDEKKVRKALKLLRVYQILQRETDEKHRLYQNELIELLEEEYGYDVQGDYGQDRKSIARDLKYILEADDLNLTSGKIEKKKIYSEDELKKILTKEDWKVYIKKRIFEDYEIKILMDAIGAASYIDSTTSKELINKLKSLTCIHTANEISDTVVSDDNIKLKDNKFREKLIKIVDAISRGRQIEFQYYDEIGVVRKLRRGGKIYRMNPYFIALTNNDYFLVANMVDKDVLTHFKITKIVDVIILDEPRKNIKDVPELKEFRGDDDTVRIAEYIHKHPSFFSGDKTEPVNLVCNDKLGHEILKEFGNTTEIWDRHNGTFSATVHIANRQGFYYWLAQYGPEIVIENNNAIKKGYVEFLESTLVKYK